MTFSEENPMLNMTPDEVAHEPFLNAEQRDELGQVVRNAWVRWAARQDSPKPSRLVPWRELNEAEKESDRLIADQTSM